MQLLIDLDRMAVVHKHEVSFVLSNLAWIECQTASYCIIPQDDVTTLSRMTDMELLLLYRNTTGVQGDVTFTRAQLLPVIVDLLERIPATYAVSEEADIQASVIAEGDTRKWLYILGAKRPAMMPELFEHEPKLVAPNREKEIAALAGKLPPITRAKPPVISHTGNVTPASVTKRPVPVVNSPKRGTTKVIVWEVADEMWEAIGSPADKGEVLSLRKLIMDKLESEHGIKRGSASSELGNWHKTRAPF